MKITYYGHSCFTIESGGYTIAVDPYNDMVQGYPPLAIKANKVCCSHGHGDHAFTDAVEIEPAGVLSPFIITEIEVPHDDAGGTKRGLNVIRIFQAEGRKVIHYGDTGCHPQEEKMPFLKGADVALMPVGGFFTIGPAEARALADETAPKTVIPMHYRTGKVGIQMIAEVTDFLKEAESADYAVKVMEYGEVFEI
ncbi:MAG: MBL fold metallo-hydrolase [Firmicutes bacterium]|nr:MBL fold metallo-hydrolase [Bacillota bacterium]